MYDIYQTQLSVSKANLISRLNQTLKSKYILAFLPSRFLVILHAGDEKIHSLQQKFNWRQCIYFFIICSKDWLIGMRHVYETFGIAMGRLWDVYLVLPASVAAIPVEVDQR